MKRIEVQLGSNSYDILVGRELLDVIGSRIEVRGATAVCVVTNTVVAPLYLSLLMESLKATGLSVHVVILEDGEHRKSWESLSKIYDELLKQGCDRKTLLIALGGGVVGDVTGFAAATYMRGIPFIQVPTTLLAQVDSSVGGKTAINHPAGKNMVGAFYQPRLVLCDIRTLATLPPRELSAGLAEVIKYAPIADTSFMLWLEQSVDLLREGNSEALEYAICRSCAIKAQIVALDEKEKGLRAILNFGHTFGHAIEAGLGYGVWLHGEGVAAGMVMAAELSRRLGYVDEDFVARLRSLISRAGLPVKGPVLDPLDNAGRYLELMRVDKKSQAGEIHFVLIEAPSRPIVRSAPDGLVREVIDTCCG